VRFFWKQRGVDSAEDDEGTGLARRATDGISPQRIAGVNPETDDITGPNLRRLERIECFVGDLRPAEAFGRRVRENVQPPRRHEADPERQVTGINEVNRQSARHYTSGLDRNIRLEAD
jgi:hypothetical protein